MPWDEQFCCCSLVGKMRRVLETMSLQNRFLRQCKNKHKKIRHTPRKSLGVPGKKPTTRQKDSMLLITKSAGLLPGTSATVKNRKFWVCWKGDNSGSSWKSWILNHLVVDDPLFSWWLVGTTGWLVFQDIAFGNTSILIFIMLIILYISYLPMEPSLNIFFKETVF